MTLNKITINKAVEFATEDPEVVPSIQSIYLSQNYEIIKPSFVKVTQYIHGTLDTHYGIFFLEFFRSSNDLEPFHAEYYSRANTLVCNHTGSESNKNECVFCKELYHA